MPRRCTICSHPDRDEIDAALVGGEAFRNIAERSGTSSTALVRHKTDHLPAHLIQAQGAEAMTQADDLLAKVQRLEHEARRIGQKAEAAGDHRTALHGIRELIRIVELLAKLRGELQTAPTTNVLVLAEWQQVRTRLLAALAPFPEARTAAATALQTGEGDNERHA